MSYFKSLFTSLTLITVILLFFIFNAYDGTQDFNGIKLYFSLVLSIWIGFGLSLLILLMEILKLIFDVKLAKISMYMYSFSWLFNIYVFFIWLISVLMGMRAPKREWWSALICLCAGLILFIYQYRKKQKLLDN
jgi:hypothetical protein